MPRDYRVFLDDSGSQHDRQGRRSLPKLAGMEKVSRVGAHSWRPSGNTQPPPWMGREFAATRPRKCEEGSVGQAF